MALNPTKKDLDAFLAPKVRKFVLTNANVLAMFTTPVENVIPGVPRYVIVPMECYLTHPEGTGYAGGPGAFQLYYDAGANQVAVHMVLSNFLASATATAAFAPTPASSGTVPAYYDLDALAGVGINAKFATADPTTGTFPIYGLVRYYLLPHSLTSS